MKSANCRVGYDGNYNYKFSLIFFRGEVEIRKYALLLREPQEFMDISAGAMRRYDLAQ